MPSPSISTSITSPCLRNTGGFRANPTPGGVPVAITSPGSSVAQIVEREISAAENQHHMALLGEVRAQSLDRGEGA